MNDTLKTISMRFSCRSYISDSVDRQKLEQIGMAALQSPSSKNSQNWEVIIINNKQLMDELNEAAMEHLRMIDEGTYGRIMEKSGGKMFYNAPSMALVLRTPNAHEEVALDCGIVAQNIALAAQSLGVNNVIARSTEFPFLSQNGEALKARVGWKEGYSYGIGVLLGYAVQEQVRPPHEPKPEKLSFVD